MKENWGAWIFEHKEGKPRFCYVNTVVEFSIMNETGLLFLEVKIFAHRFRESWWEHPDINYFSLLRLGLPEKCIQ